MSDTDKIFVEVSEQYIKSTSNAHFIYYNYGLHGLRLYNSSKTLLQVKMISSLYFFVMGLNENKYVALIYLCGIGYVFGLKKM